MRRRLTVILASDVAGYSRLVALDEETTIARFAKLRTAVEDLATSYHGRVFNTAGDAILAEFESATDAVRCAIEVQETARSRSRAYPASQAMLLRIGIAIGDVIVQPDGDLLGDGVNIAARLEGLATPGGIVVSQDVFGHVERNLSVTAVDLGPQQLKNIARPVHALSLTPGQPAAVAEPVQELAPLVAERRDVRHARVGSGALSMSIALLLVMGAAFWWYISQPQRPTPAEKPPAKPPVVVAKPAPPVIPVTPPTPAPAPPPEQFGPTLPDGWTPPDGAAERRSALIGEIARLALPASAARAEDIADDFLAEPAHKALAAAPGIGYWQSRRAGSEQDAATVALEACHLTYGRPCVLVARDEVALSDSDEQRRTPQVMPRVVYAGSFDPARMPILTAAERARAEVQGYAALPAPKAMAIHPLGRIAIASGTSVQDAEMKALTACDAKGSVAVEGPCRTYALDGTVVLPQRRSLAR